MEYDWCATCGVIQLGGVSILKPLAVTDTIIENHNHEWVRLRREE